jgi:hypothetical protein
VHTADRKKRENEEDANVESVNSPVFAASYFFLFSVRH